MTEYARVKVYEPISSEVGLKKVNMNKWDLFKIILNGTTTISGAIFYNGETFYIYKFDKEASYLIGNVEVEE